MTTWTTILLCHFLSQGAYSIAMMRAARRNVDRLALVSVTSISTAVLGLIVSLPWLEHEPYLVNRVNDLSNIVLFCGLLLLLALLRAVSQAAGLRSQRDLPSAVYGPLSKLNLAAVLLFSIVVLGETPSLSKLIGMVLAVVTGVLVAFQTGKAQSGAVSMMAIPLALLGVFLGATLQIATKVVVDPVDGLGTLPILFVIGMNSATGAVAAILRVRSTSRIFEPFVLLRYGIVAGFLNLTAFGSLALALAQGEASIVYATSALTSLIPPTAVVLFGERVVLGLRRSRFARAERVESTGFRSLWPLLPGVPAILLLVL